MFLSYLLGLLVEKVVLRVWENCLGENLDVGSFCSLGCILGDSLARFAGVTMVIRVGPLGSWRVVSCGVWSDVRFCLVRKRQL